MKTSNKPNLSNSSNFSKTYAGRKRYIEESLKELTCPEIISALIGATNNEEVTSIIWRNFDLMHENPALFNIVRCTRRRIFLLNRAKQTEWSYLMN